MTWQEVGINQLLHDCLSSFVLIPGVEEKKMVLLDVGERMGCELTKDDFQLLECHCSSSRD